MNRSSATTQNLILPYTCRLLEITNHDWIDESEFCFITLILAYTVGQRLSLHANKLFGRILYLPLFGISWGDERDEVCICIFHPGNVCIFALWMRSLPCHEIGSC